MITIQTVLVLLVHFGVTLAQLPGFGLYADSPYADDQSSTFRVPEAAAVEFAPIVKVSGGGVRGALEEGYDGRKVHLYQGIQYGQAKRFRKPEKAKAWGDSTYDATVFRYACPQPDIPLSNQPFTEQPTNLRRTRMSNEDCLFLNVFRPADQPEKKRPVMVWIHGGTYVGGTIFDKGFDASYIVTIGDVIVVTVNYRLGALGFLLGDDDEHPGNLGLYDQILALHWVKENIEHFGGDPSQVTLFGESAGAMSVGNLVLSPLAEGLFHRVILQSGSPNSFIGSENRTEAHGKVNALASMLDCALENVTSTVKCIETKSTEQIQSVIKILSSIGQYFEPAYGTELLPLNPVQALKSGKFNQKLDVLFGLNRDEGAGGVYAVFANIKPNSGQPITVDVVKDSINMLTEVFRLKGDTEVAEWYSQNLTDQTNQTILRNAVADVYGDYNLVCPVMFFVEQMAKIAPTNRYYSYRLVQPVANGIGGCEAWMGVCHGMDILSVFGLTMDRHKQETTHADYILSHDIIQSWTAFAKTGQPSKFGSVDWVEAFDQKSPHGLSAVRTMWLDVHDYKIVNGFFAHTCDGFWRAKIF